MDKVLEELQSNNNSEQGLHEAELRDRIAKLEKRIEETSAYKHHDEMTQKFNEKQAHIQTVNLNEQLDKRSNRNKYNSFV